MKKETWKICSDQPTCAFSDLALSLRVLLGQTGLQVVLTQQIVCLPCLFNGPGSSGSIGAFWPLFLPNLTRSIGTRPNASFLVRDKLYFAGKNRKENQSFKHEGLPINR